MNEFCVIHDKEFVAKAKLLGLSEDSLDRVIYDYRKNHQGDNPSDDYIRAQFEGTNVVSLESYDNAITVWQDKYSSDILFATSQELIRAKQEALKYFGKEAIKDFVNSDGKFVLRVAEPTIVNTPGAIFANRNFDQYYKHLFEGLQRRVKGKEAAIKQINAVDGTNFGYRNGKFYMNTHPTLHGVKIEGINKEIPIRRLIARDELMNYLIDKFQLNYEELKDDEFNRRFGTAIVNNAIVVGDTVYVRQSRVMDLNNEQFIEEFLHPTVHAVAGNNRELFNKLLAEAKKDFSLLNSQIKALYNDLPQEVQDEELVTQVLAKYVNKEISDKGTNTRKLVDYIKQFFEWIAEQFQDLFGEFTMGRNQFPVVSGKDIRDVLNFDEFAQIINVRNLRFGDTLHDHIGFNNRTIIYNEGQQDAINQVTTFINDKLAGKPTAKQYFTIEGEAGTGKTTIINAVVSELVKANKRAMVHVSAVSHKATTNIYNKVKSAIPAGSHVVLEAHTIAGELGAQMDEETGEFTIRENDSFNPAYIDQADIIFIDEASMINEEVFEYINEKVKKDPRLAIVFLGDLGQLPPIRTSSYYQKHPVSQNEDAPVFNEEITTKVTLTERVRQGEASPILDVSHRLHEAGLPKVVTSEDVNKAVNTTTKDAVSDQGAILYKKGGNRGSFLDMIEDAFKVSRDSNNPFHIKIVSYTNDSVSAYNQIIRGLMFPGEIRPLVPKDILTFYTESKIIGNKKEKIHNSEDFSVVNVEVLEDEYGVTYYRTTLTDGDREVVTDLVLRSDTENYQKWQTVKAGLWNAWRNETDLFKKRGLKQKAIDYSYNGFGVADYGYAITSHKAQGSTYDISVVDRTNILSVGPTTNKQKIQSLYTAVTRASNVVVIVGDVDNGSTQNVEALNTRITAARFGDSPVTEMPNTMPVTQEVADFAAEEGDILGQQQQTAMPTNLELGNSGTALLNNPNGVPANYSEARSIVPSDPEERTYQNSMAGHQLQSGGAYGSDTLWDVIGSREFGLEIYDINHYRDAGNVILASTLRGAPFNRTAMVVDLSIARREIKRLLGITLPDTIQGNLKARNYYQVSNAEVVVAIATFDNPIEENTAWMNAHVNGGTDVAVQLGIAMNKPVYVFDPVQNKWAVYKADAVSEKTGGFVPSGAPSLYEYRSFAGVGTRDIESYILKDKNGNWVPNPRYLGEKARLNAIRAIREVYSNTVLKRANMTTAKAPEVVPVEDTPINIYAGTGENADLSNFAERPFNAHDALFVDDTARVNPEWSDVLERIGVFKTVEGAFQAMKVFYSSAYTSDKINGPAISAEGYALLDKLKNASGAEARSIGRNIKGLDSVAWDNNSSSFMKAFLKASFRKNPQALQRLLSTGNTILTHTQDKGKWGKEFPRILMEVREELRKENTTPESFLDRAVTPDGVYDNPENFNDAQQSEEVIDSPKTILSNEELKSWNEQGITEPRILVASERTDPVFHVKELIDVIEGRKTVKDFKGRELSGKDFNGLYIITKHDGLPMKELLLTKIPKLIHFSITGLGGSRLEPGVMKPNDLLDRIAEYIKMGLDPDSVTIRIDPIVPGVTTRAMIENIVKRAAEMGVKRIKFSVMDAYANTQKAFAAQYPEYDFSKYYEQTAGTNMFHAKKSIIDGIYDFMLSLKDKYGVELHTCAEPFKRAGINFDGCLSVKAVNAMLGTQLEDKGTNNNQQRTLCTCFGGKVDALAYGKNCSSHCIYCYAKHDSDAAMRYYDKEGNLLDNALTRTSERLEPSEEEKQITSDQYVDDIKPAEPTYKQVAEEKVRNAEIYDWEDGDTEFLGYQLKYVDSIELRDGAEVGARNPHDGTILLNLDALKVKFEEKAWRTPDRSNPNIPDFLTFLEMMTWVLLHEVGHDFKERFKGEDITAYESRVNEWANLQVKRKLQREAQELAGVGNQTLQLFLVTALENKGTKYTGMNTITVTPRKVNKATRREALNKALFGLPISSLVTFAGTPTIEMFQTIRLMREVGMNPTNTTVPVDLFGDEALIRAARAAKLEITEDGKVRMPAFIKGLTEEELNIIEQNKVFIESGLFRASELNTLAKMSVFKVSEFITMLLSLESANQKLLGDDFKDVNFVGMSRIDIIDKVGLYRLFDIVKERVFNSSVNDEMAFSAQDKADMIYDNFEAFMQMGFSSLINMEEISLDGFLEVKSEINETIDPEDEQSILEIFGSSAEHWQVGFRQISAYSSLSQLIKRTIEKLYVLDKNGNFKYNEFGLAETVNPQDAVTQILNWVQYAETLDDMVELLKQHVELAPWLNYLINDNTDPNNPFTQAVGGLGKLVGDDEQFKSQFFSNFKKYFQKYSITYKDQDGKTVIKIINEHGVADEEFAAVNARYESYDLGHFPLRNTDGTVNTKKLEELKSLGAELSKLKSLDANALKLIKQIAEILTINSDTDDNLRLTLTGNDVENISKKVRFIVEAFERVSKDSTINPFSGKASIVNDIKAIIITLNRIQNETLESVSYEAGKMYYSYVMPSYLNKLVGKLQGHVFPRVINGTLETQEQAYQRFLQSEYGQYKWFYDLKNSKWRNYILQKLATDLSARRGFDHKASLHFLGTSYADKSPAEYAASLIQEFLYDDNKKWAWYRMPTMSNKPSEEYIKFLRFHEGYMDAISNLMVDLFILELDRIATVTTRNKVLPKDQLLKNFDKNGLKFQFLDFLEEYRDAKTEKGKTDFGALLRQALAGEINPTDGNAYNDLIQGFKNALKENTEEHFLTAITKWKNEGFINDAYESAYVALGNTPQDREDTLREYFWNDMFMTTQILELTITDIAYYKDTEDLQKRLAQLHAPGMRGNILAKDIKTGKLVTDGFSRTFYIKDDVVKADVVENLRVVEKQMLAKAQDDLVKNQIRALFADIIDAFELTNVADAQAYSSPTSYRKKMHVFGKWDLAQEDLYNKVVKGDGSITDLEILWQPLKPFVYSQISKSSPGLYDKIKVGVLNKNSEYLLIIADAILRGNQRPNRLSAIFDVMEESSHTKGQINDHGIDTVQFESTVKAGLTGIININDDAFVDLSSVTVDDIKKVITDKIYTTDEQGNKIYNEAYVHSIPFEDYAMQQEVPAHFKGEQQQGSQDRILGLSDTPNTLPDGTPAYLEVNGERITVEEAKKRYFKAIADNIEDSTAEIIRRFKLDNLDPKMRNIALSRMLRDEILRDSRFDSEMLWACSVNKDGDFNIPLSDPTQSNRIQQLLNSIIKNTIDKQKIAGGPVVQVSNYGTSTALAVRFADKNGNILLSRREFEEIRAGRMTVKYSEKRQSVTEENGVTVLRGKFSLPMNEQKTQYKSYEEYLEDRQHSFAYLEAYAPLLSEQFVEDFADENGNIDMEKVERVAPDLLKMIAYRIPTEAKYSILPIKIVGFLPASAGEGIMLPAEITTMTGSDFDVDKMYIMRHLLRRTEEISQTKLAEEYAKFIEQGNEDTIENRKKFRDENASRLKQPVYKRFERGRLANNDTILDIQWANLTSPEMLTQVWTPGNFDEPKKYGYLIQALSVRLTELDDYKKSLVEANMSPKDIEENLQQRALEIYNELKGLSTNSLKEIGYQKKNLIYADTQMDFHRQNMVAAKLIGVFAQANVSHAFIGLKDCEGSPCTLNLTSLANDDAKEDLAFVLNNKIMEGHVYVDRYMNYDGVRESALLASLLAASVDAVKDPVLNLMNINIDTVNVAVSLIRLGFGIETAALLLSQPYIKQILVEFNKVKNVTNLRDYIAFTKKKLMDAENFNSENLWLNRFKYTDEFFIKCFGSMNNMDRIVILDLVEKLLRISDAFGMITHMTRYNSITAAVGPFASDTMDMKLKDEDFYTSALITDSLKAAVDNPILKTFRDNAYRVEEMLLGRNIIQASPSFLRILKTLKQRLGYLRADIAEDFTDFFMSYYMQLGSTQVFDLSDERRKYMLTQYATDFLELKTKYPDNALLQAIHFNAANNNEQYPFLSLNLRGRNNDEVQAAKAGWTELLNDDKKAALDIAEYCFFRGGMGFSPKTFTRIMPNAVKAALSSYIAKLNNYSDSMFTDAQVTRMINQFILHNIGENGLIKLSPLKANNSILDLNMIFTPSDINSLLERKKVNTYAELVVQKGQPKPIKITMYTGLHTVAIADKLYTVYIDVSPTGARTIQIVDILGGRREGLELNTTQDFPRTVFEQQEREAPQTPVTPAADDTRYDMISALMFNLYDADELAKLDTIADVTSDEMTSFVYDIQTRYEKAIGRPTTYQEKIRLYNSKSQVAKVLSQLKTLMPNQYAEVLNKANQTLNEINLCS